MPRASWHTTTKMEPSRGTPYETNGTDSTRARGFHDLLLIKGPKVDIIGDTPFTNVWLTHTSYAFRSAPDGKVVQCVLEIPSGAAKCRPLLSGLKMGGDKMGAQGGRETRAGRDQKN